MRVIICGGGVIGACTALFLRRHGIEVVVVERTEVAAAASGKAGGFLARDWCASSPLDALARRSFALHAQLAQEIAGDWGYRPMTAYSGFVAPTAIRAGMHHPRSAGSPTASSSRSASVRLRRLRSFIPANLRRP